MPSLRRAEFRMEGAAALELLARAPFVHLAGSAADGEILLRTLNSVVVERTLYFHGSPHGEKARLEGRRVAVSAERVVATIPSYFVDPEMACPATTYYVSSAARGVVETVTTVDEKARVLTAFMERHQPEGGHAPIDGANRTYHNVLAGLWVAKIELTDIMGKRKVGQNRSAPQIVRIVEGLWQRGGASDLPAIREILSAHPERPVPTLL